MQTAEELPTAVAVGEAEGAGGSGSAGESNESKPDRFKTFIAILIAVVAVVGAGVTWQATVLASDAGAENAAGMAASLNIEQAHTVNLTRLYQHYSAYTTFARYREQGRQNDVEFNKLYSLSQQQDALPRLSLLLDEAEQRRNSAFDMASAGQYFFPTRYLDQDGRYNLQREAGEANAEAARQNDLNADAHFALSDQLRERSNNLIAVVIVLTIALLLYTLAEALRSRVRVLAAGAGLLLMLGGIVAAVLIGV
jgi:hypothetical protein